MASRNGAWKVVERLKLLPRTPYWFGDAQALARTHPYTFYAPSQTSLEEISVGELVKVWFEYVPMPWLLYSGERMWVKVSTRDQTEFTGTLVNTPIDMIGLKEGDAVTFRTENILSREVADPEGDPTEKFLVRCVASDAVLNGAPVDFLSRSEPRPKQDHDEFPDSGWSFLAAGESGESVTRKKQAQFVSIGAVLDQDDRWLHLIDSPPGSQFEWSQEVGNFVELQ